MEKETLDDREMAVEEYDLAKNEWNRAMKRRWYYEHREQAIERSKAWRLNNPERYRHLRREWERCNPDKVAKKENESRWRRSGMKGATQERYDELLQEQKGLCAICHKPNKSGRKLAWDHAHLSNQPRGLLCGSCNIRLGWVEKFLADKDWFEKSEAYLAEFDATPTTS